MKRKVLGVELAGLSLCLLLSGCGSNSKSLTDMGYDEGTDAVTAGQSADNMSGTENRTGEDTEGESEAQPGEFKVEVGDFYQYVNAEWIAQNQPCGEDVTRRTYSEEPEVNERVMMLLKEKGTEDNHELFYLQTWFQQWIEAGDDGAREIARVRELMDRVQGAKTPEELYELMKDDELSLLNPYMQWNYAPMTDGSYGFELNPDGDLQCAYWTQEQTENATKNLEAILCKLGYSEKQSNRMVANTLRVDEMITNFWDSDDEMVRIDREESGSEEVLGHIFDIQQAMGYTYTPQYRKEQCYDWIRSSYPDLLEELLSPENLEKAKDYYAVRIFSGLYPFVNKQLTWEYVTLNYDREQVGDVAWTCEEYEAMLRNTVVRNGSGILEHAYTSKYISTESREQWEESFQQVKEHMIAVIKDSSCLDTRVKEKLAIKVKKATLSLGEYMSYPNLSEVRPGENAVDSYLGLLKAKKSHDKRYLEEGQDHTEPGINLFQANAVYDAANVIFIGNGLELFALQGEHPNMELFRFDVLAHELAHALDSQHVTVLSDGSDSNFFSDEQQTLYDAMMGKIAASIDGRKTQFGNVIHGEQVSNEAFCDLFSVKSMLRYWKDKGENDMAPIFEAYAIDLAAVITEDYDSYTVEYDTHIPFRERVNYVLGHFDEFYEIYAVEENSPCFVPKKDRVSVFE